jgi:O-Antigen ligase
MLGLMAFMFRFDMVYSIYLFSCLYLFPSGISIASSNVVLMTVIPMIWAVRAASTRTRLFRPTMLDAPHALFIMAYLLSLMNVETHRNLVMGLQVIWQQITVILFFLLIVTLVDNEKKLMRVVKVACTAYALVFSTALVQLVAPNATIIPGWIDMTHKLKEGGAYSARVTKMRISGALHNDANLADFGAQVICLMAFFAWRAKNPIEKTFWTGAMLVTLVAVLSTGNRGGTVGLAIALGYGLYLFRRQLGFQRLVIIITGGLAIVVGANWYLTNYTYATSPIDRLLHTQMVGMVPETRTMTWWPSIQKSMQHPFVGTGPFFEVGAGLTFQFWPHNAYLYYLQTIGLVGLGAFLWLMTRVGKMSVGYRKYGRRRDQLGDLLALMHVSLVVFAIQQAITRTAISTPITSGSSSGSSPWPTGS